MSGANNENLTETGHGHHATGVADGHHDDHHHDGDEPHGTMQDYVTGFVLSVILTVIPFWLVMNNVIADSTTAGFVLLGLGAVQVVVHMIYFLHMNAKSEGGWNMLGLIFTLLIVVIMLAGSLWVMHHLHVNMMPMPADMSGM